MAPGRSPAVAAGFDGLDFVHYAVHAGDHRLVRSRAGKVDSSRLDELIGIVGAASAEELEVLLPRARLTLQHGIGKERARGDRGGVLVHVERVIEVRDVGPFDGVRVVDLYDAFLISVITAQD